MSISVFPKFKNLSPAPRRFLGFMAFNVVSFQCFVGPAMVLFARKLDMPASWVGFLIAAMPLSMVLVMFTDGDIAFSADSGFWEIFEHGRRLLFAIHRLRRKVAPHLRSPWGPERGLRKFRAGWQATQEWQAVFRALIEVAREEAKEDNA